MIDDDGNAKQFPPHLHAPSDPFSHWLCNVCSDTESTGNHFTIPDNFHLFFSEMWNPDECNVCGLSEMGSSDHLYPPDITAEEIKEILEQVRQSFGRFPYNHTSSEEMASYIVSTMIREKWAPRVDLSFRGKDV